MWQVIPGPMWGPAFSGNISRRRARREDVMKRLWGGSSAHRGRIFISYRRKDTTWFVGRLDDSLSHYFGDGRVFRDVGDIEGGADFHHVLGETLQSADALIAVIGPDWLSAADENGERPLDNPDDWVAQEIAAALDRGIPVYPVLVEDTPMPRERELPPALKRLSRYNAVSIGDDRWDVDVTRLARIVGLDIPSATDRALSFWNRVATIALVGSVWLTMAMVAHNYLHGKTWFYLSDSAGCGSYVYPIIEKWQSGLIWFILVSCAALLFTLSGQLARPSKKYLRAGAWVGSIGAIATFALYLPVCGNFESAMFFFLGIPIATTVLGLMNISRFTPK